MLANDTLVQGVFHTQQFIPLAFQHFGHWDARPAGDHLSNLLLRDVRAQQLVASGIRFTLTRLADFLLQRGNLAVLNF